MWYEYPEIFFFLFWEGGGYKQFNRQIGGHSKKKFLLPEKFIIAPKFYEIFTRVLWFTET